MKKQNLIKRIRLVTSAATLALCLTASAQQVQPPPIESVLTNTPVGSFFGSVTKFFTTFNPDLTNVFASARGQVWLGAEYVSGLNTAASLGLEYPIWKSISLESVTRNAGVAGTILSQQGGVGLSFNLNDVQLTGYVDGGYDLHNNRAYAAIGARVKKALTAHTFVGVGIETQFSGHKDNVPVLSALLGFTF
jgi:hypothetical protein